MCPPTAQMYPMPSPAGEGGLRKAVDEVSFGDHRTSVKTIKKEAPPVFFIKFIDIFCKMRYNVDMSIKFYNIKGEKQNVVCTCTYRSRLLERFRHFQ